MEENAENLISQNPRDSLILRRKDNLALRDEASRTEKRAKKLAEARSNHDKELRGFAPQYLAVEDKNIFDSLSPQEKNALSKLCESSCWRWLVGHTSIFISFFGYLAYLGVVYDPGWFVPAIVAFILYIFLCLWESPIDYINFIKSRRILQKNQGAK